MTDITNNRDQNLVDQQVWWCTFRIAGSRHPASARTGFPPPTSPFGALRGAERLFRAILDRMWWGGVLGPSSPVEFPQGATEMALHLV